MGEIDDELSNSGGLARLAALSAPLGLCIGLDLQGNALARLDSQAHGRAALNRIELNLLKEIGLALTLGDGDDDFLRHIDFFTSYKRRSPTGASRCVNHPD